MYCARTMTICAVLCLAVLPQSAGAGFTAHGSAVEGSRVDHTVSSYADHALAGGTKHYSFKGQLPEDYLDRVFDERHDRFLGFGPDGNQTLTVDESVHQDVTAVLGRATRLNLGGYEERMLCYVSARPGDDSVVLFTLSKCPGNCVRVNEIQVRAKRREVRVRDKCAETKGMHAGIATQSGLRLGLTRAEVEAILGPPQHVEGGMWFYAALRYVRFSKEEHNRRGYFPPIITPDYPFSVGFDKYIVLWFKNDRVSALRVNLDWDN